jgi:hypothetical protein
MSICKRFSVAAIFLLLCGSLAAEEIRIGIEKNSRTNLPIAISAFEPMANAIRSSGAMKYLRLSVDAVDSIMASAASQSPALVLLHTSASNAIQASGEYTPIASFEMTTCERLTLLTKKSSGIDTLKELSGKRVIVGKQGGYVSSAAKRLLVADGVDVSTIQFKHVRYADLKLSMMQAGQAEATIAIDKETIHAWKAAGGLTVPISGYPMKQLLVHSSVNAETKAKLKRLFEVGSMSAATQSALTTAGLRLAGTSAASND